MTKFSTLGLLAVITLLLALPAVVLAQAQPPRPAVFGGTATVDGAPAADGLTVTAWIDGAQVASAPVAGGSYAITIAQPPGENYGGKEVSFMVGDAGASETGTWEGSGGGELNLNASSSMVLGAAVVGSAWAGLAQFLVDGKGMTLYAFTKDTPGAGGTAPVSACTSAGCMRAWPPLWTNGDATAKEQPELRRGVGAKPDLLGSYERTDGGVTNTQVTYNGWPLYYYFLDTKPGDVVGQYGQWYAVNPTGDLILGGTVDIPESAAAAAGKAGAQGPGGPPGVSGPAGKAGEDGAAGKQGAAGKAGAAGKGGAAGKAGAAGSAGAAGKDGAAGTKGDSGAAGAAGRAGASGGGGLAIVSLIIAIVAVIGAGGAIVMGRRT